MHILIKMSKDLVRERNVLCVVFDVQKLFFVLWVAVIRKTLFELKDKQNQNTNIPLKLQAVDWFG